MPHDEVHFDAARQPPVAQVPCAFTILAIRTEFVVDEILQRLSGKIKSLPSSVDLKPGIQTAAARPAWLYRGQR